MTELQKIQADKDALEGLKAKSGNDFSIWKKTKLQLAYFPEDGAQRLIFTADSNFAARLWNISLLPVLFMAALQDAQTYLLPKIAEAISEGRLEDAAAMQADVDADFTGVDFQAVQRLIFQSMGNGLSVVSEETGKSLIWLLNTQSLLYVLTDNSYNNAISHLNDLENAIS